MLPKISPDKAGIGYWVTNRPVSNKDLSTKMHFGALKNNNFDMNLTFCYIQIDMFDKNGFAFRILRILKVQFSFNCVSNSEQQGL